jgi:hypothetical protein
LQRRVISISASIAVVAAVVIALVLSRSTDDSAGPVTPVGRAHAGVCTAAALARNGDAEGAKRTFFDESHQPLHDLATAAAERDRGAAARLLEAKEKVESDLTAGSGPLADDLEELAVRTAAAATAAGERAPEPCAGGGR